MLIVYIFQIFFKDAPQTNNQKKNQQKTADKKKTKDRKLRVDCMCMFSRSI